MEARKYLNGKGARLALVAVAAVAALLGYIDPLMAAVSGLVLNVHTSAGTVISISASTPATFNQAGYEASLISSSLVPIGEIVDGGEHGREYQVVRHLPMASRGVRKFKGSFDEGSKTLALACDTDDAGQIIAKAAVLSDNDYTFKVAYPNGDADYFQAKVTTFKTGTPGSDSVRTATITLELTTSSAGVGIVEVLAP